MIKLVVFSLMVLSGAGAVFGQWNPKGPLLTSEVCKKDQATNIKFKQGYEVGLTTGEKGVLAVCDRDVSDESFAEWKLTWDGLNQTSQKARDQAETCGDVGFHQGLIEGRVKGTQSCRLQVSNHRRNEKNAYDRNPAQENHRVRPIRK